MGRVILFKNNKGGVGKSLLTFWTGHILSSLENLHGKKNKVLILTSDSQNNILQFAGIDAGYGRGLEGYIEDGHGELMRLRKGLFYIPLTTTRIKSTFENKFLKVIEIFKKQYDFILIDGSPVLKLDDIFLDISDKVVIPTFLDNVTTKGMINLIKEIGVEKVAMVVPNRVGKSKMEKEHLKILRDNLDRGEIQVLDPIFQSSKVMKLTEKGKTIMETKSIQYKTIQSTFVEIVKGVM